MSKCFGILGVGFIFCGQLVFADNTHEPEPPKRSCNSEKNCAPAPVKLKGGDIVGAVVYRTVNDEGEIKEWIKDATEHKDAKGNILPSLVWSPEETTGGYKDHGQMNWQEAMDYCAAKGDLGKKWSLPEREDYRLAFNPLNPDNDQYPYNKTLVEALDTANRFLWSSSVGDDDYAWGVNGFLGRLVGGYSASHYTVRCIGR